MRIYKLIVASAVAVFITAAATTAVAASMPNGVILGIDQGLQCDPALDTLCTQCDTNLDPTCNAANVPPLPCDKATDPLCSQTGQCVIGSCFSMEVSPGFFVWTNFGSGTDGGIVVGKAQASGGQELAPSSANTTPGQLSAAWSFFSNFGTFYTPLSTNTFDNAACAGGACAGKTVINSFFVGWNGNSVPMSNGVVNDYQINPVDGGAWSLDYSAVVPHGDPSGFGDVNFRAIFHGTITTLCHNVNCNDNNVCTDDSCDPATGGCIHTNNTAPCSDNNACTLNDTCAGGVCVPGSAKNCSSNNVCKTDGCIPATGVCTHVNNTAPCDDNNACTSNDICGGGTCHPGTPKNCSDNNACTTDTCTPATGACVNTADVVCQTGTCDPSTGCNLCSDAATRCNDNNVCTDDTCNPANGACIHTNNTLSCNDNNACTEGDFCSGGICAGVAIVCDDGNICTTDSCDTVTGCIHINNTLPCDDNNACTLNDVCSNGVCAGTAMNCDDNNVCTTDSCVAGVCQHVNNTASCTDNNACTDSPGDACSGGSCKPGTAVVCATGTCDPMDGCHLCSDAATRCDDKNICTTDTCETATGNCVNTPIANCTTKPPTAPILVYPPDGQTGLDLTTELRWKESTDPNNNPITYKIIYCTTPNAEGCTPVTVASRNSKGVFYAGGAGLLMIGMTFFGGFTGRKRIVLLLIAVLFAGGTLISCSKSKDDTEVWPLPKGQANFTASGLSSGTTYYWKVVADDGKLNGTSESAVQSFTTK